MKKFKVTDGRSEFLLNLPTKLNEIKGDYLKAVTENIIIAPYHAIVATVYRCKLPEVISSNKKSRAMAVAIVPLIVSWNTTNDTEEATLEMFRGTKAGDKIVIAGTDLERGYQLNVPNNFITIDNIVRIYNHDNNFAKNVMMDQNYYYFVDFKLVPITDIKGVYKNAEPYNFVNPFVTVVKNKGNEVKVN